MNILLRQLGEALTTDILPILGQSGAYRYKTDGGASDCKDVACTIAYYLVEAVANSNYLALDANLWERMVREATRKIFGRCQPGDPDRKRLLGIKSNFVRKVVEGTACTVAPPWSDWALVLTARRDKRLCSHLLQRGFSPEDIDSLRADVAWTWAEEFYSMDLETTVS